MERSIELLACIQFSIIGLSHLLPPHVWVDFVIALRDRGFAGVFANGFLNILFGSLIVSFHNVWAGLPTVLTLAGWAQIVTAQVSFTAPHPALRGLRRVAVERAWEFQGGGAFALGLSGLMAYVLARG